LGQGGGARLVSNQVQLVEAIRLGRRTRLELGVAERLVTAQRLAAVVQIPDFRTVVRRLVEKDPSQLVVKDRNTEAVAELANLLGNEALFLIGNVLALAALAGDLVALDRLCEDHHQLASMIDRSAVANINLLRIVTTAPQ